MRINDDGSLNIPNVNRRKHQGTWHCLDSQGNGATLDIKLQIAAGKKTSNVTFILQALFTNSCASNLTCPFKQKHNSITLLHTDIYLLWKTKIRGG